MPIPFKSEEESHKEFLKYQIDLEKALQRLHNDVDNTIDKIIRRNTNREGKIDKTKIKLIVDKYMRDELKDFRLKLKSQITGGVADSTDMGMRSVIGAVAPDRKVTSLFWVGKARKIRRNILKFRGIDGLKMSERIWKLNQDNIYQLKRILSSGILQGNSADKISRDVRGFLLQPETLRGRARAELTPGKGIYKSAYKNALRLTRTETNRAYVDGQKETTKAMGYKMQFKVSGINTCSKCNDLHRQIFEPDEFPAPVHPHCMCYALTVLPQA